jgi:hypothetical protein
VTAFRLSLICNKNASVRVIDLGLVNHTTTGLSEGLGWGLDNYAEADFKVAICLVRTQQTRSVVADGFPCPFVRAPAGLTKI